MSNGIIKNTLVFQFPETAAGPTLVEIARFVKTFDADKRSMESSYKISDERVVCIKFKTEAAMKEALLQNPELHTFQYSNGTTTEIRMTVAGGCIRYVRVFDLPPEVSDIEVSLVLGKYGTIKRMVREKFPAELELDLFTGVRGIYMDIKKEVPSTIYVVHRRGRVYYEGLKQRCFLCKEEGHLKVNCPQNKRRNTTCAVINESIHTGDKQENTKKTYAGAVIGMASSSKSSEELQLSMVKLVSSRDESVPQTTLEEEDMIIEVLEEAEADVTSNAKAIFTESDLESAEGVIEGGLDRSNKRPLTTSSKSSSDDGAENFVTIERNRRSRKQKRCGEDGAKPNPLETIAATACNDGRSSGSQPRRQQENRSRSRSTKKVSVVNADTASE